MAAALTANAARAADYALRVEAPAECADEARLLDAVRVRSPGFIPIDWNAPGVTRFLVRFLPQDASVIVELETTDPSGARSFRTVPAQDCPEAIRASAWILTLLVDPNAATGSGTASGTSEPTPEPKSAAREDSPPESTSPPKPRPWHISVGAFGGVLQTALPETPLGFGAFVEWAWERESWLRPSARLAGLDAGSGVSHTDRGDVDVSFVGARLSLCPVRTSRAHLVSARLCALGEFGKLSGEGQDTVDQGSAVPTWYAAGPALGGELQPWSFLALELEAALIFPFNRDRFVFGPDPVQVGYEVPPVSASVAVGIAWRH